MFIRSACLFLLAQLLFVSFPVVADNADANRIQSLRAKIESQPSKRLPVIVQFNDISNSISASQPSSSSQQRNSLSAKLGDRQQKVIERIDLVSIPANNLQGRKVKRFKVSPLMGLDVNQTEFEQLLLEPNISVWEDKLMKPSLAQSVPSVYPTQDDSPYHGNNQWAVAVLDTGVDTNHAFLAGKLLSEACYSNRGGAGTDFGTSSLCPGGVNSSTAAGSGQACSGIGCEHGTQIAGVAVGNGTSFDGIARDAKLISIQVFSKTDDLDFCDDGNCLGVYPSDMILGLERVYALRNTYDIAAVNLSFGSSELFPGTCDLLPEKTIIDLLKQSGIAVVAASGNNGNTSQMASPACISSSIAVAATADSSNSPWVDNNTSSALDIFAPGINITSSVAGGGFATSTGTSMAAPHVAGAFAVMRHASPNLSVNAAKNLITSNGTLVTQNSVSRRRLNLSSVLLKIDPSLQTFTPVDFVPAINLLLLED